MRTGKNSSAPCSPAEARAIDELMSLQQLRTHTSLSRGVRYSAILQISRCAFAHEWASRTAGGMPRWSASTNWRKPSRSPSAASAARSAASARKTRSCSRLITTFSTASHARSSASGGSSRQSAWPAIASSVSRKKVCVSSASCATDRALSADACRTNDLSARDSDAAAGCCSLARKAWCEEDEDGGGGAAARWWRLQRAVARR